MGVRKDSSILLGCPGYESLMGAWSGGFESRSTGGDKTVQDPPPGIPKSVEWDLKSHRFDGQDPTDKRKSHRLRKIPPKDDFYCYKNRKRLLPHWNVGATTAALHRQFVVMWDKPRDQNLTAMFAHLSERGIPGPSRFGIWLETSCHQVDVVATFTSMSLRDGLTTGGKEFSELQTS